MWSSLYNRGELKIDQQTDKGARIPPDEFSPPSSRVARQHQRGGSKRMAELTGREET